MDDLVVRYFGGIAVLCFIFMMAFVIVEALDKWVSQKSITFHARELACLLGKALLWSVLAVSGGFLNVFLRKKFGW